MVTIIILHCPLGDVAENVQPEAKGAIDDNSINLLNQPFQSRLLIHAYPAFIEKIWY